MPHVLPSPQTLPSGPPITSPPPATRTSRNNSINFPHLSVSPSHSFHDNPAKSVTPAQIKFPAKGVSPKRITPKGISPISGGNKPYKGRRGSGGGRSASIAGAIDATTTPTDPDLECAGGLRLGSGRSSSAQYVGRTTETDDEDDDVRLSLPASSALHRYNVILIICYVRAECYK